jgi:hypothetical protein
MMDTDESLRQFGLVPADESLPRIRALLEQEAAAEREGRRRTEDLALLCCVQLFSRGYPEDILRIWLAKMSGMDLGCMLDVQFLCGAGLDATKRFLSLQQGAAASAALKYIQECEAAGGFNGFTPAAHLEQYRHYFGVA